MNNFYENDDNYYEYNNMQMRLLTYLFDVGTTALRASLTATEDNVSISSLIVASRLMNSSFIARGGDGGSGSGGGGDCGGVRC